MRKHDIQGAALLYEQLKFLTHEGFLNNIYDTK